METMNVSGPAVRSTGEILASVRGSHRDEARIKTMLGRNPNIHSGMMGKGAFALYITPAEWHQLKAAGIKVRRPTDPTSLALFNVYKPQPAGRTYTQAELDQAWHDARKGGASVAAADAEYARLAGLTTT